MSDEPTPKKFKLSPRETPQAENPSEVPPASPSTKPSLKLRNEEVSASQAPRDAGPQVETYLKDAYGKDRARTHASSRKSKYFSAGQYFIVFVLFCIGTFGYAHYLQKWPVLEPVTWYVPFGIVILISTVFTMQGIAIFKREGSISMLIFGLLVAGALGYWNVSILETTAKINEAKPFNPLWAPDDPDEMLRVYLINQSLRGNYSLNAYTDLNHYDYLNAFRDIPQKEWQPYFKKYLNWTEINQLDSDNIGIMLDKVAERMHAARNQLVADFEKYYFKEPSLTTKLKAWAIMPYTYAFQRL